MGNRSRFVVLTGVAAGVAGVRAVQRARRHARLRQAVEEIAEELVPPVERVAPPFPMPTADAAHAPGHRHLEATSDVRIPPERRGVQERPFAKRRHGLRHPGKG